MIQIEIGSEKWESYYRLEQYFSTILLPECRASCYGGIAITKQGKRSRKKKTKQEGLESEKEF